MLTEEKFVKRAMALIMIMFAISSPGAYNHILSDVYTCVVFDILYIYIYHKYKDIWVVTEGGTAFFFYLQ